MASGGHSVTAINIFVTLCFIYESLVVIFFPLLYIYVCSVMRSSSSEIRCKGSQDPQIEKSKLLYYLIKLQKFLSDCFRILHLH